MHCICPLGGLAIGMSGFNHQGTHCTRKVGEKFPDSKGKIYFDLCCENFFKKCPRWTSQPEQFCVSNSHKSRKLAQGKCAVGQGKHLEFEDEI